MKKLFIACLVASFMSSLTACGGSSSDNGNGGSKNNPVSKVTGPDDTLPDVPEDLCKIGTPETSLSGVWLTRFASNFMSVIWRLELDTATHLSLSSYCSFADQTNDLVSIEAIYHQGPDKITVSSGATRTSEHGTDVCAARMPSGSVIHYKFEGRCLVYDDGHGPYYFVRHL